MKKEIEDNQQPSYTVHFRNEGKKHFRKLKTKVMEDILDILHKQGFYDVEIIEILKIQ